MDAFSYLSVLLSIILGLAMTQILQGYRALLLARGRVRLYAPALIWSALLLLFSTQAWWASFGLRDYRQWNFIIFAVILLQMVLIYMMTAVLLPDVTDDREVDLERHYHEQRRHFFGFLIATVGASILKDVLLNGHLPGTTNLLFQLALAAIALLAAFRAERQVQLALALMTAGCFSAYIVVLFARL